MKAYGYLRVSGRGQIGGDGFPRQREAITRYAKAHGIEIVAWYTERGISGGTEWEDRPAWSEMMQALNGVRTVIIEKLDRLARELFVQEYILRDLTRREVRLVSATEDDIDADPTRVLMRQIMGAIAQYDRAMTVTKLRQARKRAKVATGRCEGRKPYGERTGESAVVARMRELHGAGLTFTAIAGALAAENIPTRVTGGRWHAATVRRILRAC